MRALVPAPLHPPPAGQSSWWVEEPLRSGARRACAAASWPASAAVQLPARPSECGLRLRGERRAWGPLPLVWWWVGQGSRVGGGVHWALGSGRQLQRRRVGGQGGWYHNPDRAPWAAGGGTASGPGPERGAQTSAHTGLGCLGCRAGCGGHRAGAGAQAGRLPPEAEARGWVFHPLLGWGIIESKICQDPTGSFNLHFGYNLFLIYL